MSNGISWAEQTSSKSTAWKRGDVEDHRDTLRTSKRSTKKKEKKKKGEKATRGGKRGNHKT